MVKLIQKRLPQEVSSQVLMQIADGEYPPGMSLPSENKMAEEFGVSRIVIREAAQLLRNKGVVEIQQGRGTFVRPLHAWNQTDPQVLLALLRAGRLGSLAQDLVEIRKMLEVEAAGLAAARANEEDIESLRTSLDEMQKTVDQTTAYVRVEHQFHIQIWQAARNTLLEYLLNSFSEVFRKVKEQVYDNNWEDPNRHHRALLAAIKRHDSDAARTAMEADISEFQDEIRQALERGFRKQRN